MPWQDWLPSLEPPLPPDYDCRSRTQCASCGHVILLSDALNVVRRHGHDKYIETYCGEACANEDMLESLRSGL